MSDELKPTQRTSKGTFKRPKRNISGWLVLDKPLDMTSTQAVGRIKFLFQAAKAGHAGTLDPLATGCLPIALGEATKTVPFAMDSAKIYQFAVCFGVQTATDDAQGEVIAKSDHIPSVEEITAILPEFIGEIEQIPPQFSALKINGERAYDLARSGQKVDLKPRRVRLDDLVILSHDGPMVVFEAMCGKGAYVRSLARDIGLRLGSCGYVHSLRRLQVGPFFQDYMISLDSLEEISHRDDALAQLDAKLKPIETALDDIPALALDPRDFTRLNHGQPVMLRGHDAPDFEGAVGAYFKGKLVAFGEIEQGMFRARRLIKASSRT